MISGRHGKDDYMRVYCCTDDLYCDATSVHVCACMYTHIRTVCDNITLSYRFYETKRKRNDLFRCT